MPGQHAEFGETWFEFLSEGRLQEILETSDGKLQQRSLSRGKGKGKGKAKGKSMYGSMTFIDPMEY